MLFYDSGVTKTMKNHENETVTAANNEIYFTITHTSKKPSYLLCIHFIDDETPIVIYCAQKH